MGLNSQHDWKLNQLEPLAQHYFQDDKLMLLSPLLAGSIFCGVTWGVMGLQYVKWIARKSKNEKWSTSAFATYLMLASTAYLALFSAFICYFFGNRFGLYAQAFDLTYTSWLFLIATVFSHAPCQGFYAKNAYKLAGDSKTLAFLFVVLIGGIVGLGAAIKATLADVVVDLSWLQSFLIKFWIALTTVTDVVLTLTLAILLFKGKSKRYTEATFFRKIRYLVIDAQLSATVISVGLLVILMWRPENPITHLWLGLPLIFPVNVFSTLNARRAIRDDLEAEAGGEDRRSSSGSVKDEKPIIPPAEKRPSFLLSPFPTIAIRRASTKFSQYTAPITAPVMSGVRRASQLLGVMPPLSRQPGKKRTFPFRQKSNDTTSGFNSPVELHPSSLAYPLSADAAPMGEHELIPRGKELQRQHSLTPSSPETGLNVTLGQAVSHPMSPTSARPMSGHQVNLSDPFAGSGSRSSRSPSPRPATFAEALEAHEIFEMPSTPDMMSPKSHNSPLMVQSPDEHVPHVNPEWK